jgi:hypothetical protein
LFGRKSVALAPTALLLMAAPAFAAPATSVTLDGSVEVATALPGVEPSSLLSSSDAAKALEAQLAAIGACVDGVAPSVDDTYKVALDVDGAGKVTAVRPVESHVPEAAARCADDALKAATVPALSKSDATATLTVTLRMKRAAQAAAVAQATDKAAEAPAAEAAAAPPAAGEGQVSQPAGALQATTTAETKPEDTKPWKVGASLTQWIGQGTFVKDSFAATPDYGYLAALTASYRVHEKVSVGTRFVWIQQLTTTHKDGGTIPREATVWDTVVSASAPKLYKEETTGIELGAGASVYLPISKASRAQQRLFGLGLRGNVGKTFEKIGPGDLSFGISSILVKNFGPAAPDNDYNKHPTGELCRASNRDDNGSCLTSNATNNFFVISDFNVAYTFLEDWTVSIDLLIWNSVSRNLSGSNVPTDLAAGSNIVVGTSPYATSRSSQSDLSIGTIALSYAITKNFSAGVSLYTYQPLFIQDGSNSRGLRFPFWDFRSAAENYSSFNLDLAFTY